MKYVALYAALICYGLMYPKTPSNYPDPTDPTDLKIGTVTGRVVDNTLKQAVPYAEKMNEMLDDLVVFAETVRGSLMACLQDGIR